jgi:hypothetical protein
MAVSDEMGRATRDGVDVSTGAQRALKNALAALEPYADEPRIAALVDKVRAIGAPEDFSGHRNALADQLMKVQKAVDEGPPLGLEDRTSVAKATHRAQMNYLRQVSPGAAAALDREREFDRTRQGGGVA